MTFVMGILQAQMVTNLALEPFLLPGDHGFALGGFLSAPLNKNEAGNRSICSNTLSSQAHHNVLKTKR